MKNFLKIQSLVTHLPRQVKLLPRNGWRVCFALCCCLPTLGYAHEAESTNVEQAPKHGLKVSFAGDGWWLYAKNPLPTQSLKGYLLQGDTGVDVRRFYLNHGAASIGLRVNDYLAFEGTAGFHGDEYHTEKLSVWLSLPAKQASDSRFDLRLGRLHPNLGSVFNQAGHFDDFGLTPLGVRATTLDHWIDDGVQVSAQKNIAGHQVVADVGLWRGRNFPGSQKAKIAPSIHIGVQKNAWQLDGFATYFRPRYRGAAIAAVDGGHQHGGFDCSQTLKELTCFDGRSIVTGVSVAWKSAAYPLKIRAATLWRFEKGSLESIDSLSDYSGRTGSSWLDGVWQINPQWQTGLRYEYLMSRQKLAGGGASILVKQANLDQYHAGQRLSAMVSYQPIQHVKLNLEGGVEKMNKTQGFVMLRAQVFWDGFVGMD